MVSTNTHSENPLPSSLAGPKARVEGSGQRLLLLIPAPSKLADELKVATDERFFLGATPTLELPFCRDGIGDAVEELMPDERHGPPLGGVASVEPALCWLTRSSNVPRVLPT